MKVSAKVLLVLLAAMAVGAAKDDLCSLRRKERTVVGLRNPSYVVAVPYKKSVH